MGAAKGHTITTPLIPAVEPVNSADRGGRGIGTFKVFILARTEAIVAGAEAVGAPLPVVCQIGQ